MLKNTTTIKYKSNGKKVYGKFIKERENISFNYFSNYIESRQYWQDHIVEQLLHKHIKFNKPTLIFMIGRPGSGKTTYVKNTYKNHVLLDPDIIKPYFEEFIKLPINIASGIVHREAVYITYIAQRVAERLRYNIVIDRSVYPDNWLHNEISRLKLENYTIEICEIDTSLQECYDRCKLREQKTKRHVPKFIIDKIVPDIVKFISKIHNYTKVSGVSNGTQ